MIEHYECFEKATGQSAYKYDSAGGPVAFDQFPFETYEHRLMSVDEDAPNVPPEGAPSWITLIDIGPFMDRFGDAKYAILKSKNEDVIVVREDMKARKYIDIAGDPAKQGVMALRALVPEVTDAIVKNVLHLPVALSENFALRMTYFNGEGGRG